MATEDLARGRRRTSRGWRGSSCPRPRRSGWASELDGILSYIDKLRALDTEGVEPTSHAVPLINVMRDDEPAPSLPPDGDARQRAGPGGRPLPRAEDHRGVEGASTDLTALTVHELAARFRARAGDRPAQAARAYLDRIAALDPRCKAFLTVHRGRGAGSRPRAADARFARRRAARAARRRPGGAQGHLLHARRPHHVAARGSSRASCRPTTPPWSTRLREAGAVLARQAQHGRVRDGLVHRELRASSPRRNPVGPRARARRLVRRLGGGGRGATWRRCRSAPTPAARSASPRRSAARRPQADLRPRVALRGDRVRVVARPGRPVRRATWRDARRRARGDRRARPARLDLVDAPVPDYAGRARGRRRGPARRGAARVLHRRASTPRSSGAVRGGRSRCSSRSARGPSRSRCRTPSTASPPTT